MVLIFSLLWAVLSKKGVKSHSVFNPYTLIAEIFILIIDVWCDSVVMWIAHLNSLISKIYKYDLLSFDQKNILHVFVSSAFLFLYFDQCWNDLSSHFPSTYYICLYKNIRFFINLIRSFFQICSQANCHITPKSFENLKSLLEIIHFTLFGPSFTTCFHCERMFNHCSFHPVCIGLHLFIPPIEIQPRRKLKGNC